MATTSPSYARVLPARAAVPLPVLLACAGMFTCGWERLGRITIGGSEIKVASVLFALALVTSVWTGGRARRAGVTNPVRLTFAVLFVMYCLDGFIGVSRSDSLEAIAGVIIRCVLPFLAISRIARTYGGVERMLNALIAGVTAAAVFGIYQAVSASLHLPYPLPFVNLGPGLGRVASVSYEPAYFCQLLMVGIGAVGVKGTLNGGRVNGWVLGAMLIAVLLANSRAALIMVPVFMVLGASPRHGYTQILLRFVLPLLLIGSIALLASPSALRKVGGQLSSIVEVTPYSSNATRVSQYRWDLRVFRAHRLLGVGPDGLLNAQLSLGYVPAPGDRYNNVIANDVWLQALDDGGILLLAAQILFVATIAAVLYRRNNPGFLLVAAWLAILLVEGTLTSNFYDPDKWAALGLICALAETVPVTR